MREAPAISAFILALGTTQTIAWASSCHLPAILAAPATLT
jgi:hypothetical protein